jgi:predicted nucleotide-binding protein
MTMIESELSKRDVRKIVLTTARGTWEIEAPMDIAVDRIIAKIVRSHELGLKATDESGELIKYRLFAERQNLYLDGAETLLQAGVAAGDTLAVMPGITAGGMRNHPASAGDNRDKVFIVHGHDDAMREAVARFLEKVGFKPIILHEHAGKGRTIIEKFEHHSDVKFAVILLSPDDLGSKAGAPLTPRARQNVLLGWGYFMGRLGRDHALALKKGDIELPSDLLGILWEPFDEHGSWKFKLARELEESGYNIDWKKATRP